MAGIGGPGKHHVHAVDLPREEHAVTVVGQEGVLQLVEGFEVLRPGDADGGPMVSVAPCHVVFPFQRGDPGIVPVFPGQDFRLGSHHMHGFVVDFPVQPVLRESGEKIHGYGPAVAAEHPCESVLIGHHGAVEHAVGPFVAVPADDGIAAVAPDGFRAPRGLVLPGHVGDRASDDFCHMLTSPSVLCRRDPFTACEILCSHHITIFPVREDPFKKRSSFSPFLHPRFMIQ